MCAGPSGDCAPAAEFSDAEELNENVRFRPGRDGDREMDLRRPRRGSMPTPPAPNVRVGDGACSMPPPPLESDMSGRLSD